jgi:hypothetical protein
MCSLAPEELSGCTETSPSSALSQHCDEAQCHHLIKFLEPHQLIWGAIFGANHLATAAREACQIVDLFAIMREALGRPDRPEHLRSDTDRATWWGAPGNVTAFRTWLTKISTAEQAVSFTTTNCAETDWKSLVESTRFTDLTPTLPQRIRQGGWHAGRAENPALTPLVTDESALGQELVTPDTHPIPHPIL